MKKEPRKANVVAVGHVECLVLESDDFHELLSAVHDDVSSTINQREEHNLTKEDETTPSQQDGSVEGDNEEDDNLPSPPSQQMLDSALEEISFEEIKVLQTIGTGTFGRVKLVQHKSSGRVCALKCMMKAQIVEAKQERNIMYEKDLLIESRHPFILQLINTYNTQDELMMLMEIIQGGELWSFIYDREDCIPFSAYGGFVEPAAVFYACCVIEALDHVHSLGIAYRDLKVQ